MPLKLFTFSFPAMGGTNELQIYHEDETSVENIFKDVLEDIKFIEEKYSRYKEDSIVSQINRNAGIKPVEVDKETAALIDYAEVCYKQSNGLFDLTSGILREAWDFKSSNLPSQDKINSLLPKIGWDKVEWKNPALFLTQAGMQIDFGGIGKEFAVDRVSGILQAQGAKHCLINLAGDIRILGPHPDDSAWSVGIKHPRKVDTVISSIFVKFGAITTSGDYERFLEHKGKRYSHLLNPKTGWPVESFQSVTLIGESCLVAGSICTIAMLLGETEGLKFLRASGREFFAINQNEKIISK